MERWKCTGFVVRQMQLYLQLWALGIQSVSHLSIPSLIQLIFIGDLLCARCCSRCRDIMTGRTRCVICGASEKGKADPFVQKVFRFQDGNRRMLKEIRGSFEPRGTALHEARPMASLRRQKTLLMELNFWGETP